MEKGKAKKSSKEIIKKYPNLFGEPPFNLMETLIGFGFDVDYGWYSILEELFEKLDKLQKEQNLEFKVVQVKEKFGSLSVYVKGANDDVYKLINDACRKASTTCEVCGEPGILRSDGWYKVTCEEHK